MKTRQFNGLTYREVDHGLTKKEAEYIAHEYQRKNPDGSYRLINTASSGWKVYWRGTKL